MLPTQICFTLTQPLWFRHVPPHSSSEPLPGFWGSNMKIVHQMVLRPKPPNYPWVAYSICVPHYSTRVTSSLTARSPSLPEPPFDLHVCHLDSINTITPPCTLALVDVPKCQPLRLVTRPPSPSVQALRPSFIAPSPSARYVPTWPLPRHRPPPPSFTSTHHKSRDMLHNPTHAMVSSQTQPKTRIMLIITHHKSEPQGHISTMCSQSPPWWVHCQHQHTTTEKKIEEEKTMNSPKWPKAKTRSFEMSKTWFPKTWAMARHN
jgi:hypothetical protein